MPDLGSEPEDDIYEYLRREIEKAQEAAKNKMAQPPKPIVEYEQRVVCWIDILGFEQAVRQTLDENKGIVQKNVDRIARAINRMREEIATPSEFGPTRPTSLRVEQFSDSILITFLISPSQVLETLIGFQLIIIDLIVAGFPSRGCIGYGHMVHTEDLFFGPAFLDVYANERKLAIFPRVILDESIVALMVQNLKHDTDIIRNVVAKDIDDLWYIDYFEGAEGAVDDQYNATCYYDALRKLIEAGLKTKDRRTRQKYSWMKTKYNQMLRRIKDNIRNSKTHPDPELETFYLEQNLIR